MCASVLTVADHTTSFANVSRDATQSVEPVAARSVPKAGGRTRRRMPDGRLRQPGFEREELDMIWDDDEVNCKWFNRTLLAPWRRPAQGRPGVFSDKCFGSAGEIRDVSPKSVSVMPEQRPTRRIMLRGALAAGCSLLLPYALSGCNSKQEAAPGGAVPSSSPPNNSASPAQSPANSTGSAAPTQAPAESPASAAPAQSPATGAGPTAGVAPVKVPQESVKYQAQPKGDQKCSGCTHFIAESNTCKLVEGQVSPDGWCTLWAKKV
jgi:hypothetical protein